MGDFRMPSLGADMEAGKLVQWLKQPGDKLSRGDVVAVVETQKGAIEIEVFQDGVLEEQLVAPGAVLPVGAVMARIGGEAEAPAAAPAPPPAPKPSAEAAPTFAPPPAVGPRASPAARKRAQELGVDLAAVQGTGPGGAVTLADVEAAKGAVPPEAKPPGFDFSAMRRAIAAAMARSKREIPHYYLSQTVDIGAAQDWVAKENEQRPPAERLLIGALYLKAVAKAARAYPEFNGFYAEDRFQPSDAVHAGVAIAIRGGGLAAPAIHNADALDVAALMAKMRDLVARVRAGRFRSSEISDPTITVTSLGDRGVDAVWGVIYPPQVAIVGFGRIVERPWIVDGAVRARTTVCATLAADHRVSYGHRGALFLDHIGQLLAAPDKL